MSDKQQVRDYDITVAPGVQGHTHEETIAGKNVVQHTSETAFEGRNVVGSASEKTKITMVEDTETKKRLEHEEKMRREELNVHAKDLKQQERDIAKQHDAEIKRVDEEWRRKQDAMRQQNEAELKMYEQQLRQKQEAIKAMEGDIKKQHEMELKQYEEENRRKQEQMRLQNEQELKMYEKSVKDAAYEASKTVVKPGATEYHAVTTSTVDSSQLTFGVDGRPIIREYDYQPAPGIAAHTHEETKSSKNVYEHKAATTFEGANTTGSAYEKTTVKIQKS